MKKSKFTDTRKQDDDEEGVKTLAKEKALRETVGSQ